MEEMIHFDQNEILSNTNLDVIEEIVSKRIFFKYGGNHQFYIKLIHEIAASIQKLVILYQNNPESRPTGCNRISVYVVPPKAPSVSNSVWGSQVNV